jgi:U4/U6 small nuclear ribonucleoprotein PRP31
MDTNLAPSTLTESLLDDLDDLSETEGINRQGEFSEQQEEVIDEPSSDQRDFSNETIDTKLPSHWHHHSSKNPHKRLLEDPALQKHLLLIRRTIQNQGTLSEKNDYELITSTNKFLSILMDELHRVHTELKSAYKAKFPELEELLTDPILYRKAIGVIQNEMDLTLMNEQLNVIAGLSPNQIITLSVAASTTAGRPLTDIELQKVQSICDYLDEVHSIQVEFISFIEHRMDHLAPNICAIIGPTLAARMVGLAGGLLELSRIPSCNLIVLGQNKHTSASRSGLGMSLSIGTVSGLNRLHQGILGECELVTQCPVHLQRKVLKLVANKLALAIRADVVNVESSRKRTRDTGINLRREIEDKIEKLEEPDKAPTIKALPKYVVKIVLDCINVSTSCSS